MNSFKNIFWKGLAICLAIISFAPSALAHPGHNLLDHGTQHALSSPDHLLVLGVSGMLLIGFGLIAQKKHVRRGLFASGSLAIAGAMVLWSMV